MKFKPLFVWLSILTLTVLVIQNFIGETYFIPSSSMEDELMAGDFIWVNKFSYGPRFPETLLAIPFTKNKLPFSRDNPSYLTWLELPYFRLPGIEKIKRNDVLVFNFPGEDGAPVDKKSNFVKRCIGMPGDTLEISDKNIFINNKIAVQGSHIKYAYEIYSNMDSLSSYLYNTFRVTQGGADSVDSKYVFLMTPVQADSISKMSNILSVKRSSAQNATNNMFPGGKFSLWNKDFYGPIVIPQKGKTIQLNVDNIDLYFRLITRYEKHALKISNDSIYIDCKYSISYTFKMDYYFALGDNRDYSEDSRYWGFVPEDHIIGKGSFILFSLKQDQVTGKWRGINWKRLFTSVR